MKVAHVCLYPPQNEKHVSDSGVASYTKNLLTNLPADNADTHYVICNRLGDGTTKQYEEGRLHITRSFDRTPASMLAIHKQLRRIRPDVIHLQHELSLYGNLITAYLVPLLVLAWRRKMVVTLHGVVSLAGVNKAFIRANNYGLAPVWAVRLGLRLLYGPLARFAGHIVVHEPYFKQILNKEYGIAEDKISVIPHGVEDFQLINKRNARQQLNIPANKKVVLFMGYAAGYKGIDLLLEGFAEYAKVQPNAMLLVGAGMHPKLKDDQAYKDTYTQLKYKAALLISADQYRWVGFIKEDEVGLYYSASDVSVYPYQLALSSSGPMSFAIGHRKPFLASAAFKQVFARDFIFENTPDAMATKLADFFAESSRFKDNIFQLRQSRLWSRVGQQTAELYKTIG